MLIIINGERKGLHEWKNRLSETKGSELKKKFWKRETKVDLYGG